MIADLRFTGPVATAPTSLPLRLDHANYLGAILRHHRVLCFPDERLTQTVRLLYPSLSLSFLLLSLMYSQMLLHTFLNQDGVQVLVQQWQSFLSLLGDVKPATDSPTAKVRLRIH